MGTVRRAFMNREMELYERSPRLIDPSVLHLSPRPARRAVRTLPVPVRLQICHLSPTHPHDHAPIVPSARVACPKWLVLFTLWCPHPLISPRSPPLPCPLSIQSCSWIQPCSDAVRCSCYISFGAAQAGFSCSASFASKSSPRLGGGGTMCVAASARAPASALASLAAVATAAASRATLFSCSFCCFL